MIFNVLGKNELEFLKKITKVEEEILDIYTKLSDSESNNKEKSEEYNILVNSLKKLVDIENSIFKVNSNIDFESLHNYLNQQLLTVQDNKIYIYSRLIAKINTIDKTDIIAEAFFIDNARNETVYFEKYIKNEENKLKKKDLCDTKYSTIYTRVILEEELLKNNFEICDTFYDSEDLLAEYNGLNEEQYEAYKEYQVATSMNELLKMFMLPDSIFQDEENYAKIIRNICYIKAILLKTSDMLFENYYKNVCQIASKSKSLNIKMLKEAFDEVKEDKKSIVKVHFRKLK